MKLQPTKLFAALYLTEHCVGVAWSVGEESWSEMLHQIIQHVPYSKNKQGECPISPTPLNKTRSDPIFINDSDDWY